ncbi:LytTR family transcriptional regulator DNA-binding domain-containing protein [Chryseolinea lacunae]|uniref:LytTR family transcriptional regulator DNA-binding domain-containing protein n=1 Tax=Chryseolinea lacunae TaxID=2801331 RepID=A0ABS1KTG1_9BACT|nr:LytTR family transcriptional regulator DNA-binding domain-containing protein [Chryseolinea lacunae]MBL0742640.1 LytTR family transcriptional regulator DNA-binding domain-containing protein [Chryseolinea lacunae]
MDRKIFIQTPISIESISHAEILFVSFKAGVTLIKLLSNRVVVAKRSVKQIEKTIDSKYFYRCHAKYLINLACMARYVPKHSLVVMADGTEIRVAKERKSKFKKYLIDINLAGFEE